ncbi:BnaAnng34700D [Brassica napus]|uniref:BnaAnng34700D protein n=1 Tax=Brassica napus TaxID=3708 RepID=A0A078JYH5_BRANA|nr:BnaAnng34700D [Brassica napus]
MSSEENNLIEILEEGHKVDIAKYIDYVTAPQAGAIATFSGTTRDTFEGKTVMELSSCWRNQRFLIDELKASVPIWKKEVYANGEVWKENAEFLEKRLELAETRGSLVKKHVAGEHKRSCCGSKVRVQEDEDHTDIAGDNKE